MTYLYYLNKTILVVIYLSTVVYGWRYFMIPVIEAYGWLNLLFTMFVLFVIGFISTFLFLTLRKPTPKEITNA